MAETVHLTLKGPGGDIKGESTQTSLGREDTIECIVYEQEMKAAREAGTNMMVGRRMFMPLRIVKRIDKSSPLLKKALTKNEKLEATFKFYRPKPDGSGETEQYYTVALKGANIAGVRDLIPNTLKPDTVTEPPTEEVFLVFQEITWRYEAGGAEHTDTWKGD